jgi:hypothetical protein
LPERQFRYSGSVATSVLPSPVYISAIAPRCRITPPTSCTSKWRMPSVRTLASRTRAKASGSTSSMVFSPAAISAFQALVCSWNCCAERPLAQGSSSLTRRTSGSSWRTTRSLREPKMFFSQRPESLPSLPRRSVSWSQSIVVLSGRPVAPVRQPHAGGAREGGESPSPGLGIPGERANIRSLWAR